MEKEKVNRRSLEIKQNVPSNIFERPVIRMRIIELFNEYNQAIDSRIEEIAKFINLEHCPELKKDSIKTVFRSYFCDYIANEAVRMAFMEQETYDIEKNIIQLLTKGQMRAAIYGKPMILAFARAIRMIPNTDTFDALQHGSTIMLLTKYYTSTKKQTNRCGECGCSCTCDAGCKGDWQKCTSTRECNHHCGCYIAPMVENMPDKNRTVQCHTKHNENCDE